MKAIRTYSFQCDDHFLVQRTFVSSLFDQENESLDDPDLITLAVRVEPGDEPYMEGIPNADFLVFNDTGCSLDILLSEIEHFTKTLKQMYYGS